MITIPDEWYVGVNPENEYVNITENGNDANAIKLKELAKLLDEIHRNNNYKIEPFTISIKLYLTITGNPMKTVIDYNNEYRKENTAIYRKLKSYVIFN